MSRREFIIRAVLAALAWPQHARAQNAGPTIGYVFGGTEAGGAYAVESFRRGLAEAGFIEDQNLRVLYRWAAGQYDGMPAVMGELVSRKVDVIVSIGNAPMARAAKAATRDIPIVFGLASDPVEAGVVASLNRPGGNATGVSYFTSEIAQKRLELLCRLVAAPAPIALIVNPNAEVTSGDVTRLQAAAALLGRRVFVVAATRESEIEPAVERAAREGAGAIFVSVDIFLSSMRHPIIAAAMARRLPTSFNTREPVADGGLMSYGDMRAQSHRDAGLYVGRILKGAKPSDLPVLLPTRFEFVLNLKTAKALGIEIPAQLLALVDEVIE